MVLGSAHASLSSSKIRLQMKRTDVSVSTDTKKQLQDPEKHLDYNGTTWTSKEKSSIFHTQKKAAIQDHATFQAIYSIG